MEDVKCSKKNRNQNSRIFVRGLRDVSWSLLELQPYQELKKAYIYGLCGSFYLDEQASFGLYFFTMDRGSYSSLTTTHFTSRTKKDYSFSHSHFYL